MKFHLSFLLFVNSSFNALAWVSPQHAVSNRKMVISQKLTYESSQWGTFRTTKKETYSNRHSGTQLYATEMEERDAPALQANWVHAVTWLALVAFTFSPVAPGSLGSDQDNAMLQAIINDPLHPEGINSVFYVVFNLFGPMPVILASLLLPQQSPGKLSAGPFLIAASGIGYFAMGIYMTLRSVPDSLQSSGWFSKNVAENKLISWALVAFCLYVYIPLPEALATDISGFVDLLSSSRFASIASLDLTILYAVTTKAIADDYRLRVKDDASEATKMAFGTAIVPYLGAALYCALRPSLSDSADE